MSSLKEKFNKSSFDLKHLVLVALLFAVGGSFLTFATYAAPKNSKGGGRAVCTEYAPKVFIQNTYKWASWGTYGVANKSAAWYYPELTDVAVERVNKDFKNYVAFWHGVEIQE